MAPPEIIEVEAGEEISCDGGKTYGHPKVYLTPGADAFVDCYYCGRRFKVVGRDESVGADPERRGAA